MADWEEAEEISTTNAIVGSAIVGFMVVGVNNDNWEEAAEID